MKASAHNTNLLRNIIISLGIAVAAVIAGIMLSGCTDTCQTTRTYTTFTPIYASMADLRAEVDVLPPAPLENQGKIYIYGSFLLLGEPGKGIHVFDNTDAANPIDISFLNIPGNYDMAIKDGFLYADSYVDLLVFDFNNPQNIILVNRLENAFPLYNQQFGVWFEGNDMVVTSLEEKEIVEISSDCADNSSGIIFMREDVIAMPLGAASANGYNLTSAPVIGVGGSMARFAIVDVNLYTVDDYMMHIFNITTPENPASVNEVNMGWGIETIFPFKDNLFIGSQSGMFLYNIDNPDMPELRSMVQHISTCDPVVANDEFAFVTLRAENNGNPCNTAFANQLDVINISNIDNATLMFSYPMTSPHGLGLDGNYLFITEGDDGLKVFDISNVGKIDQNMIQHLEGFNAYDVIPDNGILILVGKDGLYQFDYSNINEIKMLSLIPIAS